MNYRGRPVPVIDLRSQFLGEFCEPNLSTRIVVVQMRDWDGLRIGLIAEKATDTERYEDEDFIDQAINLPSALQLGPVRVSENGMLQRVRLELLLTPEMHELFSRVEIT
jgi:chemotaxis-related protein WspB